MDLKLPPYAKLTNNEEKAEKPDGFFKKLFGEKKIDYSSHGKLAFVVGHERGAPGAYGVKPLGRYEYDWSRDLGIMVNELAAKRGIEARMFFRDGIGIKGAYRSVKQWKPDVTLESHFNAFNSKAQGTETLIGSSQSKRWGEIVHKNVCEAFSRNGNSRGVKLITPGGRGYLNLTQIHTSCLIEPFFGDNTEEAKLAVDRIDELALAIVLSVKEYLHGDTKIGELL